MRVSDEDMPSDLGTLEWCADYVLSDSERQQFTAASKVEKRKRDWLSGRIAAKDAVRKLLKDECGLELCPADIEIMQDDNGRPMPYGLWVETAGFVPQLSITHGDGIAYALACRPSPEFIAGIDTEPARNRGDAFEDMAFTESEIKMLATVKPEDRDAANTAFWCAKEAIAKAIGMGLAGKPKEFEVVNADWSKAELVVAVHQTDTFVQGKQLLVHCLIEDERVTAFTACQAITR
jgi:phosphopantetheinyl transferase (holo-ACP synthase)